jgi:branched-chain amino acid transport system substrate-binding protein
MMSRQVPSPRPLVLALVSGLVLALVAGACTGDDARSPIRVGAVYPLSGSQGAGGMEEFRGVRLAAEFVNADGGVDGRPISLVPIDVGSGQVAPQAIDGLHSDGIRLVVGSYGSTISVPASLAAERRGMLFWETGAVGEMVGGPPGDLVFRVPPTGMFLGGRAIAFVADRLARFWGVDPTTLRIAVTFVDDVYGRSVARGAFEEIRRRGLHLVGAFGYDPLHADIGRVVRRVAAVRADVLFVSAYVRDGIELRRQTLAQGLDLRAMIGTSSSYCMAAFGRALGSGAVGVFASDKPDEETFGDRGLSAAAASVFRRAADAYDRRYGTEMSAAALAGFSAGWALFHDVLPAAADASVASVAAAARSADIPFGALPNGSGLRFGAPGTPQAGSNVRAASVVEQWTGPDDMSILWPARFADPNADPIPLST